MASPATITKPDMMRPGIGQVSLAAEGDKIVLRVELASTAALIGKVSLIWRSVDAGQGEIGWIFDPAAMVRAMPPRRPMRCLTWDSVAATCTRYRRAATCAIWRPGVLASDWRDLACGAKCMFANMPFSRAPGTKSSSTPYCGRRCGRRTVNE